MILIQLNIKILDFINGLKQLKETKDIWEEEKLR